MVSIRDEQFVAEAIEIVQRMKSADVPLRIMAGCAVRIHCMGHVQLHQTKMQRNLRDIDVVTLHKHKKQLETQLGAIGYGVQLVKFQSDRDVYEDKARGMLVDVFYDRLNMCHSIDFVDRIELDFPTVSLADLVLQKLQIVEINERDAKDVIVLFLEHEVGEIDKETINGKYIAKLLSDDWGFYYTVTENIKKVNNFALKYSESMLPPQELEVFKTRTGQLSAMIETLPKSFKWKMRQKIGTKTLWYNEVEEKERGTLAEYMINKERASQE